MESKISKKKFDILVLPGDGVDPEVINESIKIVDVVNELTEIKIRYEFDYIGGACLDRYNQAIREET
jgi:3-isopropylmalate dehydrogenase